MKPIIRVENLTHTYGENTPFCRSAVKDVNMEIMEGEFLGVIGHTGSGKSTLIQHLNGLLRPTSGRVLLGDRDIWEDPKKIRDVRFRVGLVFQYPEYQLFEETVYKDISFGPANQGKTGAELDHAFAFLEETFGQGQELVIFVTELTAGPDTSWFVETFGCDAYFRHNRELLFDDTRRRIREEISAAKAAEQEEDHE